MSSSPRLSRGTSVVLSVLCFVLAYGVLTNQTPRCRVHAISSDGTQLDKEFNTGEEAFRYEKSQHFWESNNGLKDESSECASDYVLVWEGILSGGLVLAGLAFVLVVPAREGIAILGRAFALFLLSAATVVSIAGIYSYGPFTTPWLLPFLWLAARRADPWSRGAWLFLSGICAWITGEFVAWAMDLNRTILPVVVTGLVVVTYIATTESPRRTARPG